MPSRRRRIVTRSATFHHDHLVPRAVEGDVVHERLHQHQPLTTLAFEQLRVVGTGQGVHVKSRPFVPDHKTGFLIRDTYIHKDPPVTVRRLVLALIHQVRHAKTRGLPAGPQQLLRADLQIAVIERVEQGLLQGHRHLQPPVPIGEMSR